MVWKREWNNKGSSPRDVSILLWQGYQDKRPRTDPPSDRGGRGTRSPSGTFLGAAFCRFGGRISALETVSFFLLVRPAHARPRGRHFRKISSAPLCYCLAEPLMESLAGPRRLGARSPTRGAARCRRRDNMIDLALAALLVPAKQPPNAGVVAVHKELRYQA